MYNFSSTFPCSARAHTLRERIFRTFQINTHALNFVFLSFVASLPSVAHHFRVRNIYQVTEHREKKGKREVRLFQPAFGVLDSHITSCA